MNLFDKFADKASDFVSHAPFFVFCVLLIVLWAPSIFVIGTIDTWQLIINTITTIVTFLLVALLQNSQKRFENATNAKLDEVLDGLAELKETSTKKLKSAKGLEKKIEA